MSSRLFRLRPVPLLLLAVLVAGCGASSGGSGGGPGAEAVVPAAVTPAGGTTPSVPSSAFTARIERVVDGDTFVARKDGRTVRVRLIGVDAPESVKPDTPVACFGEQASAFTKGLLTGVTVRAAYEPGGDTDRFGRQLWDVWLPDGRFVAGVLAVSGVARAYPYRPQTRYASVIRRLAGQATDTDRGLWGPPCDGRSFPSRSGS